jgi:outer membrane protein TolC
MKKSLLLFLSAITIQALTLDEAIELGLKNSPDFLIQQNKILLSKEATKLKKASNYGKIALKGSYTRYNIPRTLSPIVPPLQSGIITSEDIGSLGIAYDVNLFSGFSGMREVEIASLSVQAAKMALKLSREQLIYNIRSVYIKILSLKSQKSGAIAYQDALQELHKIVDVGVKVGKKPKVDLLKVKADLESANVGIKELEANIEILKATLAAMIGEESVTNIEDITTHTDAQLETSDIKSLSRYQLSLIEEKKGVKRLKNAKSTYYPNLNLNGYLGNNYGESESDEIWQIGLGLNWVLFDFGSRSALIQKAKIEQMQSSLESKKIALSLIKKLHEAKAKVDIAVNKLQSAKTELALVKETSKIEKMRYKQGVGTIYDLLFSESRYQNTISKEINARYALQSAIFYYKYITENGETK